MREEPRQEELRREEIMRDDILRYQEGSGIYNQADAAGFIRLYGLPIRVRAMLQNRL